MCTAPYNRKLTSVEANGLCCHDIVDKINSDVTSPGITSKPINSDGGWSYLCTLMVIDTFGTSVLHVMNQHSGLDFKTLKQLSVILNVTQD